MRYFFGFSAGAVMGFLVFFFGKCTSGTCPLTSNAMVTVLIGGLLGIMLAAHLDVKHPPEGPSD